VAISIVPTNRRAGARIALVRALVDQTQALHSLHRWRPACAASERSVTAYVRQNAELPDHHYFSINYAALGFMALGWVPPSERFDGATFGVPDEEIERSKAVVDWAAACHLEALWLRRWAFFALTRWEVARACEEHACPWQCADVHDEAAALDLVLTERVMMSLAEEHYPEYLESTAENLKLLDAFNPNRQRTPWEPKVVSVLIDPVGGSEKAAVDRVRAAWRERREALEAHGVVFTEKRQLNRHAVWFVRGRVLGESPAETLEALKGSKWDRARSWGEDNVRKNVDEFAELIES
jgi:hypothetical protein